MCMSGVPVVMWSMLSGCHFVGSCRGNMLQNTMMTLLRTAMGSPPMSSSHPHSLHHHDMERPFPALQVPTQAHTPEGHLEMERPSPLLQAQGPAPSVAPGPGKPLALADIFVGTKSEIPSEASTEGSPPKVEPPESKGAKRSLKDMIAHVQGAIDNRASRKADKQSEEGELKANPKNMAKAKAKGKAKAKAKATSAAKPAKHLPDIDPRGKPVQLLEGIIYSSLKSCKFRAKANRSDRVDKAFGWGECCKYKTMDQAWAAACHHVSEACK